MTTPTDQTYEIRTLRDIYELPTFEQMETCLDEMAQSMKLARATSDMLQGVAESNGAKIEGMASKWPEVTEWIDDGKSEIGAIFQADGKPFLEVSSKPEKETSEPLHWFMCPSCNEAVKLHEADSHNPQGCHRDGCSNVSTPLVPPTHKIGDEVMIWKPQGAEHGARGIVSEIIPGEEYCEHDKGSFAYKSKTGWNQGTFSYGRRFLPDRMVAKACSCKRCHPYNFGVIVCDKCGNKRCPHASDHEYECTNSNEPGQEGSVY